MLGLTSSSSSSLKVGSLISFLRLTVLLVVLVLITGFVFVVTGFASSNNVGLLSFRCASINVTFYYL